MMKKLKHSTSSMKSKVSAIDTEEADILTVDIHNLKVFGSDAMACPKSFIVRVAFFDQMITCTPIEAVDGRVDDGDIPNAEIYGELTFDITDYEKMCLMADHPLIVQIQPAEKQFTDTGSSTETIAHPPPPPPSAPPKSTTRMMDPSVGRSIRSLPVNTINPGVAFEADLQNVSVGYVDILPLLTGHEDSICVRKRLQPLYHQSILMRKSWDNLPLITMEIGVERSSENKYYRKLFKKANYMKFTLVGLYNVPMSLGELSSYVAATRMPLTNPENSTMALFHRGRCIPKYFKTNNFFASWETMRSDDNVMAESDEKTIFDINDLSVEGVNLHAYLDDPSQNSTVIWGSFHRTLFAFDLWFKHQITQYKWPFETQIHGDNGMITLMGEIDLFRLLYPGVDTIRLAVPLAWADAHALREHCGVEPILSSTLLASKKSAKRKNLSPTTSMSLESTKGETGLDNNDAYLIIEVKLWRPLRKAFIPPLMTSQEICRMLCDLERKNEKRKCTARAKLEDNWHNIVTMAVASLKKVPQYGSVEFCDFIRQFADTRTKLEIHSSFCQEAAIYIHNQFVAQEFMKSEHSFQELLMISHACLMRSACNLLNPNKDTEKGQTIRAARHARQLQDLPHATDLYVQAIVEERKNPDNWRELATCLKDIDRDWAIVCLYESLLLNPRHPLTLLSMAGTIYEDDPEAAETFILVILHLFPLWTTAWVIATAYYIERQKYDFADQLTELWKDALRENNAEDLKYPRAWEHELGDWWDNTPILPGMSRYYDAADLLLRLRAMALAEVCLARSLLEKGDNPSYYHLVALCCRLRDDTPEAVCHIQTAIDKYGEIYYLRTLEAECLHKLNKIELAMASIAKTNECASRFSLLLSLPSLERDRRRPVIVDLIRRQPSAYSWIALAEDWLDSCAIDEFSSIALDRETVSKYVRECAVQALKYDKRAGRAWDMLAALMETEARQNHCLHMALLCRFYVPGTDLTPDYQLQADPQITYRYGYPLKKCDCHLCFHIRVN